MLSDDDLRRLVDSKRKARSYARPRPRDARPVGDVIPECPLIPQIKRQYEVRDFQDAWLEIVGAAAAAHCMVAGATRGVLTVVVDSAALRHELANFRKKEIIAGLARRKGCERIHDVEFRPGKLER